jgi:ppGpp synthetase/RelA/SpoT-type nucleotidyltranferase
MNLSKTQIDRLGERLKKGEITADDLRLLDTYRRSLADAYDEVVGAIRKELGLGPTGRPAKSTTSISDKLRRESIRLTQIQDIAGCRLIVPDIANQNQVVQSLSRLFETTNIADRREKPSHGYRAVHVIVTHLGKMIEIQVRTELQHLWAELSEKLSDIDDPTIKYGGGDKSVQEMLADASSAVTSEEAFEVEIADGIARLSTDGRLTNETQQQINELRQELISVRLKFFEGLRAAINILES